MRRKSFTLLRLCGGLVLILAVGAVHEALARNLWSIQAAATLMRSSEGALPPSPAGHAREAVWRASLALNQGKLDDAVAILSMHLHDEPDDLSAHALLGEALERQGQIQSAVTELRAARNAGKLVQIGWKAYADQRWQDALAAFQAASDIGSVGVLGLAATRYGLGDRIQAETLLRQSLAAMPDISYSSAWRLMLGENLRHEQRWAEAEAVYMEAVIAEPLNSQAHIGLGVTHYHLNGLDAGVNEILKGIALAPENSNGYVALADVLSAARHYADAEKWYNEATARAEGDFWLWVRRGNNLLEAGDAQRSAEIYSEVLARFLAKRNALDLASVYKALAVAYWRLGNGPAAVRAIEQSVQLDPERIDYWLTAGKIYEWRSEFDKAIHVYQQVLRLDPTNLAAHDGLSSLNP